MAVWVFVHFPRPETGLVYEYLLCAARGRRLLLCPGQGAGGQVTTGRLTLRGLVQFCLLPAPAVATGGRLCALLGALNSLSKQDGQEVLTASSPEPAA